MSPLETFGQACLDAKADFLNEWNALPPNKQTPEVFDQLVKKEHEVIDNAHAVLVAPTNPPGHPIRR